ncbi:MAG: cupin domain-containing protein [Chloroflexaceae bacterium]|jgi:quercetin dioxygenase-like cupin family protein|nr:cupin domain-containing protein [Chloroflexaceae bacterium]
MTPELIVDVAEALREASYDGPIWSANCEQMNVNLMRLSSGQGVAEHVNADLDVLLVVLEGVGTITLDGEERSFEAGQVFVLPRGTRRGIQCRNGPLVYITCHRQKGGLMPTVAR